MDTGQPTANSELNAVLQEFVVGVREVLGENFIGAYLQGSLAVGDWDTDSDVDFLVVVDHDVLDEELSALNAMHACIYHLASPWAQHLEGSYFPAEILRLGDPARTPVPFLDNGAESLIHSGHDNKYVVRWVLREYGITLVGPSPVDVVDPVPPDEMRQEVTLIMHDWANDIFAGRYKIDNRWAQPYVVLSYCRMLQTLESGRVTSKLVAAQWGRAALDSRWAALIQRAWDQRPNPSLKIRQRADPGDYNETLEFVRYALSLTNFQPMEYHPYV
jgi:hypothetical protein